VAKKRGTMGVVKERRELWFNISRFTVRGLPETERDHSGQLKRKSTQKKGTVGGERPSGVSRDEQGGVSRYAS